MPINKPATFRFDLGARELWPEWRSLFTLSGLREDLVAGLTVACIAIPLSLAIALASGVEPGVGLITAIVAGIVCAFFGGTPLAVSGPAAAMAILIASIVQDHGLAALLVVGMTCGLLQLLSGVLRIGRYIRFVPVSVIAGFTAGIGAIILIGQLPRVFGLAPPDQSHVIDVITHLGAYIHQTQPLALILSLGTLSIVFGLPKFFPKLPAPLFAVVTMSAAAALLGGDVELIGTIPSSLPAPRLPDFQGLDLSTLLGASFIVYALASLETLLSSSAVDKLSRGPRHDPDQELIGQGLGNVASSLFGGIPVTGVIARSALNVQSGAKSRRSAIIHSLALIGSVFVFGTFMSRIPVAVLAGILISVAMRMLHPREIKALWRTSRIDAVVYAITFFIIVFVDLIAGVQAGVASALAILAIRLGQTRLMMHPTGTDGLFRFSLEGPITFMSSGKISAIRKEIELVPTGQGVILDLTRAGAFDASGADQVADLASIAHDRGSRLVIQGASPDHRKILLSHDSRGHLANSFVATESEALRAVGDPDGKGSLGRLISGFDRFRTEARQGAYQPLFQSLATSQEPHTLFITCSDSRINPNLITSTEPGELFIVRNVGNIIPPFGPDQTPAEGAALEFAVGVLGVREIVVCGHSGCGAMKAVVTRQVPEKLTSLRKWLESATQGRFEITQAPSPDAAARMNVLQQLENMKTYPMLAEKIAKGELRLHGWFYDIASSEIVAWDEELHSFRPLEKFLLHPERG